MTKKKSPDAAREFTDQIGEADTRIDDARASVEELAIAIAADAMISVEDLADVISDSDDASTEPGIGSAQELDREISGHASNRAAAIQTLYAAVSPLAESKIGLAAIKMKFEAAAVRAKLVK